jgi:hypothetical protein
VLRVQTRLLRGRLVCRDACAAGVEVGGRGGRLRLRLPHQRALLRLHAPQDLQGSRVSVGQAGVSSEPWRCTRLPPTPIPAAPGPCLPGILWEVRAGEHDRLRPACSARTFGLVSSTLQPTWLVIRGSQALRMRCASATEPSGPLHQSLWSFGSVPHNNVPALSQTETSSDMKLGQTVRTP